MTPLLAQRPRVDRSFERLYRRHVADVYHYALAVLRNPADAEDVTQTTFMNAYRAYQRGERPVAAQNWLIAIAHNVCRQRFRQSSRRPQEVAFDEDVADAIVDDAAPSAHDIRQALGHLAFNQRAALVMRELEGRTYAEIGEILDLSVSAVETLIFRARRALREQLEGALTCGEAELAISRQVDRRLPRAERGPLRAHLRQCPECATFARSQRAQRAAFKMLGAVPLPASLSSLFGGGGATFGSAVAAKAAAVLAAGALVGGVGYEGATHSSLLGNGSSSARRAAPAPAEKASASHSAAATPIQEVVRNVVVAEKAWPEQAGPRSKKTVSPASARGKSASKGHGAGASTAHGRSNAAHSGGSVGASRSSTRGALTRTRASGAATNGRRARGAPAAGTSQRGSKGTTARTASPKAHPDPSGQADKTKSPKLDTQAATSAPAADQAKKSK
jgi:RNA polymerase sigma factor (sigma-70 family)